MSVYKNNIINTANTGSVISRGALSSTGISFIIDLFISISTPVLVYASASILRTAFCRLVKSLENCYSVYSVCVRQVWSCCASLLPTYVGAL